MRKASIWVGAVAVVALAAGCRGNFQSNGTSGATGTSGSADVNGGRTITLRGCVEDGMPVGTYVLRANGPAESSGAGTAGTGGSSQGSGETDVSGTRSGRTNQDAGLYRLIATGNLDFGQNLGKEVTVTGEIARQANDNTVGTTGPVGGQDQKNGRSGNSASSGNSGSASKDRRQRQGTTGEGDAGTNLENGGSRGSGGGRVQGDAVDQTAGAKFLRVTSMNKVSDGCEGR